MADLDKDKRIYELNDRIEKLQSQKNSLLKELDQTEERLENTDRLYKKYFPYIIDLAVDENASLSAVLKDLSTALKKGSSLAKIEYIFKRLQDALLKEEPVRDTGKKREALSSQDCLRRIRLTMWMNSGRATLIS